jgi:hypothetical protein
MDKENLSEQQRNELEKYIDVYNRGLLLLLKFMDIKIGAKEFIPT